MMGKKGNKYVVLVFSMLLNLCIGTCYAWSIFSSALIRDMHFTAAEAALPYSIAFLMSPIAAILCGKMVARFGVRIPLLGCSAIYCAGWILMGFFNTSAPGVALSYGVFCGFGSGAAYNMMLTNTMKFFPEKKGMMSGISTGLFGLSSVLLAPVAQALVDSQGIRNTCLFFGAVYFVLMVICSLIIREGPRVSVSGTACGHDMTWREMLRSPRFYVLFLIFVIIGIGGNMVIGSASNIAQNMIGVSAATAAVGVSLISVANAAGRLCWGTLSDKVGQMNTMVILFVVMTAMFFLQLFVGQGQWILFLILMMLVAFSYGGFMSIYPAITTENFGYTYSAINYGIMFIGLCLGTYIGPRVAAGVVMATGSYRKAFVLAAIVAAVGLAGAIGVFLHDRKKRKTKV